MRVLVTGVGGGVGQSVMKALRASSLAPYVVAVDAEPLAAGLYRADAAALVPAATDARYVEALIAIARRHSVDAIIPGSDPELPVLARSRESIESATNAVVIVSDPLTIEIGGDKARTVEFLDAQGLAFPRSATDLGGARALGRELGYPLVVKPRFGSASRGVVQVANEDELGRVWSATAVPIAQERLAGDECTCGTFVDNEGALRGVIVLRRTMAGGATYRAAVERNPEVEAYISRIATALRARGPVNVQLRIGPTGPVAFEFNPRFSGTTGVRSAVGFNEVEAALRHWVLREPVAELAGRPMTILRYWNEVFVPTDRVAELRSNGEILGGPSGEVRSWP